MNKADRTLKLVKSFNGAVVIQPESPANLVHTTGFNMQSISTVLNRNWKYYRFTKVRITYKSNYGNVANISDPDGKLFKSRIYSFNKYDLDSFVPDESYPMKYPGWTGAFGYEDFTVEFEPWIYAANTVAFGTFGTVSTGKVVKTPWLPTDNLEVEHYGPTRMMLGFDPLFEHGAQWHSYFTVYYEYKGQK